MTYILPLSLGVILMHLVYLGPLTSTLSYALDEKPTTPVNAVHDFISQYDFLGDEQEETFTLDMMSFSHTSKKRGQLLTVTSTGEGEVESLVSRRLQKYDVTCKTVFKVVEKNFELLSSDSHCRLHERSLNH